MARKPQDAVVSNVKRLRDELREFKREMKKQLREHRTEIQAAHSRVGRVESKIR